MNLAVIAFTRNGGGICKKLINDLACQGGTCQGYIIGRYWDFSCGQAGILPVEQSLGAWTGEMFGKMDGIVFIGAAGIAVRAIAPYVKDKRTDPAIVAADESGRFSIALLSGHLGGANLLAERVARSLGAMPVVTTATDLRGVFAVDAYAAQNGYAMEDGYAMEASGDERKTARRITADLLDGKPVGFFSDFPVDGPPARGLVRDRSFDSNIWITARVVTEGDFSDIFSPGAAVLKLVPPVLCVGIGCKRGTSCGDLRGALKAALEQNRLPVRAVGAVTSVDKKAHEPGILELARELGVPFKTYTAEELAAAPGDFVESGFVRKVTGVGNVCERAALVLALERTGQKSGWGEPRVLIHKQIYPGISIAAAALSWRVENLIQPKYI